MEADLEGMRLVSALVANTIRGGTLNALYFRGNLICFFALTVALPAPALQRIWSEMFSKRIC